jgi:twinkle protein
MLMDTAFASRKAGMANADKGAEVLDMKRAGRSIQSIVDEDIDWNAYEIREEKSKVIPAERLAEEGKRRMLLGTEAQTGLTLPWDKSNGKVLIKRGKLALWCGWSRHGKSNMTKQIMLHAMASNEKSCIASMEEEMLEVWEDMGYMACCGDKPTSREIAKWVDFQTGRLWFYDQHGMVGAQKIKVVIRYCAEELGVSQFVIDSLMMLAVDRDDYDAQSRFVGELKALAKDTNCTVHLICHMRKREGSKGEEQPGSLHDISGGHEISSKADYVFNVWRDISKKNTDTPECVLKVEKQRGRINWIGKLALNFHSESRQFVEGKSPIRFMLGQRIPGEDDEEPAW